MFAYYPTEPEYYYYLPHRNYSRPTRCSAYQTRPYYTNAYYSPQNMFGFDDILQPHGFEDYKRKRQLEAERERVARQSAYREWLAEQERERELPKKMYQRREHENASKSTNHSSQSRKIPISGGVSQRDAAERIIRFLQQRNAVHKTRRTLHNLYQLRGIEQELGILRNKFTLPSLTFDHERPNQVLPTSAGNKAFLIYENSIVKIMDKLDRIKSDGIEVVRDRRKQVINIAQEMLSELDKAKENQWSEFNSPANKQPEAEEEEVESLVEAPNTQVESIVKDEISQTPKSTTLAVEQEDSELKPYVLIDSAETTVNEEESSSLQIQQDMDGNIENEPVFLEDLSVDAQEAESLPTEIQSSLPSNEQEVVLDEDGILVEDISNKVEVLTFDGTEAIGLEEKDDFVLVNDDEWSSQ